MKYTEEVRARIERTCVESEIAFARRLPEPGRVLENAEWQLRLPESTWSNDAFESHGLEALEDMAKKSCFARYTHSVMKWIVARRRRKRKGKGSMPGK